ncbi:MAG: hypothetical protein LH614_03985 [Pyrinomonadaceae bacterium]|nr:hypothetical protein [Pyrinomonadaceae bacterium]
MSGYNQLRITNYELRIVKILCLLCILGGSIFSVKAQSTNQSFPTAITTSEISGKILARDLGDARLTSYFYVFNATQGDVFINVVTTNLNGDIDIFTADNLRPLAKITLYADASDNETGRVIYLRQPAKLILRIEGRTPNDDAAIFRVKFAGSFAPASLAENPEAETPQIKTDNQTDIRVNSVGTIIEIKPKPTPKPKEIIAEIKTVPKENKVETLTKNNLPITEKKVEDEKKAEVIITERVDKDKVETETVKETKKEPTEIVKETTETEKVAETKPIKKPKEKIKKVETPPAPNPLENIRLKVTLKDGSIIEHPMSEVERFNVVKGILTIITKDGKIERYSILDVAKTTIE